MKILVTVGAGFIGSHIVDGLNQRALEGYDAAIPIDTQLAEANANRAVVFTRLGQDPEAEQDIGRVITLGIDSILLQAKIDELKRWR